jgi:hypothetical protein
MAGASGNIRYEKPGDPSGSEDNQNYNCDPEILGFLAFDLPQCCYPPQEQSQENAN